MKIMNKGGRPQKANKRHKRITIRLNTEELFVIKQKAEKAKIPIASFLRMSAFNAVIKARPSVDDRHFIRQLTGVSNNINQMAKLAHQENLLSALGRFEKELTNIDELIKQLEK